MSNSSVADLAPLRGMPLVTLRLRQSHVTDLSPLRGMPLERLVCEETKVKDLSPLTELPKLREVMIPRAATNIEVLRPLRTLEYIGWEGDWQGDVNNGHLRLTPGEFWKRYDALKAAGKQ